MINETEPVAVNEALEVSLFRKLHREGHTIILVTHDPGIGRLAERRIELHYGKLSEVSVFPAYEEELIENLLKVVGHYQEDSGKTISPSSALPGFAQNRATFQLMALEELVRLENDDGLSFARRREQRATKVIHRHRLSERLFYEMVAIHKDSLDENACKIERSLSTEVTEKLCIFLKHPQTCPHGSPLPPGVCYPKR